MIPKNGIMIWFFFPTRQCGLDDSTPGKGTALVGYDDTCFPPVSHVNQILQKQKVNK